MTKTIYQLELHESMSINPITSVRRVPGGWIYNNYDSAARRQMTSIFVRFDNEFQLKQRLDYDKNN